MQNPNEGFTKTWMASDWGALTADCGGHFTTLFENRRGIKSAASRVFSRKDLDEHAPDKDHFMVHRIIMGSEEAYDANNNGDGYPAKSLEKYHPTFVSNGHVFREHRNESPRLKIGDIKAARYSPSLQRVELIEHYNIKKAAAEFEKAKAGKEIHASQSTYVPYDVCNCLVAGSLVRVRDGWTPIETLKMGDEVLTHGARFRAVTHLFKRKAPVVSEVQIAGNIGIKGITQEHPLYVLDSKGASDSQLKYTRRRWLDRTNDVASGIAGYSAEPVFKELRNIIPGDLALYPVRAPGSITPEFSAWLLGLALADGSVFGQKRGRNKKGAWRATGISLSLGLDKLPIIEHVQKLCASAGLPCQVYPEPDDKKAVSVRIHSTKLAEFFQTHFGRCEDKCVGDVVYTWNKSNMLAFIAGWIDGDGSQDKQSELIRGTSVLPALALGMWELCLTVGISCSLSEARVDSAWARSQRCYNVCMTSSRAGGVIKHSLRLRPAAKGKESTNGVFLKLAGGLFYAMKVEAIKPVGAATVYNVEVDEDNSYVVQGITTHNCCKKQAKNSSYYCDHLANHMLQYLPDFKKYAFASNPILNFFDSSAVDNPADRTARYLEYRFPQGLSKAASAAPRVITGAQWAEFEGVNLTSRLHLSPTESTWLQKLAAVETQGMQGSDLFRDHVAAVAFSESAALSGDDMQRLRELAPSTFFHKLASASVLLPFDVFAGYMLDADLETVRASEDVKAAAATLPSLFRKMAASAAAGDSVCTAGDMALFNAGGRVAAEYDQAFNHEHQRVITATAKVASVALDALRDRVVRVDVAYDMNVKQASQHVIDASPLTPLAALYGVYKVAALRDMFNTSCHAPEHHRAATAAVMQNLANTVISR